MSPPRYAARRDANDAEIVAALEGVGCLVQSISAEGVPDLLVFSPHTGKVHLIEVKDGTQPASKRKLKPAQVVFHEKWKDTGCVHVVLNVFDALKIVKG